MRDDTHDDLAAAMPRLEAVRAARPLAGRKILIIVENLPLPFDRRSGTRRGP
jgi:hypothetical protein